jgi:hypothetical protein
MSPYAQYEIARARQQEIVSSAMNAHGSDHRRPRIKRHRPFKYRLFQVVAVLSVCGAAGTAVTVSDAHSNQRPMKEHAAHLSAPQLMREISALERKGYVPTACTVSGTLMKNYRTGQSVTVKL